MLCYLLKTVIYLLLHLLHSYQVCWHFCIVLNLKCQHLLILLIFQQSCLRIWKVISSEMYQPRAFVKSSKISALTMILGRAPKAQLSVERSNPVLYSNIINVAHKCIWMRYALKFYVSCYLLKTVIWFIVRKHPQVYTTCIPVVLCT